MKDIKKKLLDKYFDKLAEELEDLFPKHECEERSQALVLNAMANIYAKDLLDEFELIVRKKV